MAKAWNAVHAEEKAEVEVLFADAAKYSDLGKRLKALQASLEGGGRTVRDAIGPVHNNTRDHQIMIHSKTALQLNNLKLTGSETLRDSMPKLTRCWSLVKTRARRRGSFELGMSLSYQYLSLYIHADCSCSPAKVGLTEYMASLKRVNRALCQMTATNIRANQQAIGDFEKLLNEGSTTLQGLFRSTLLEYAKPVEPLHYITKSEHGIPQSLLNYANAR